jgi:hypothetical protein
MCMIWISTKPYITHVEGINAYVNNYAYKYTCMWFFDDRLCGLVVRVLGYRSGGPGSISGTTRFFRGKKKETRSGSGTGSTQPREYNWGATW